MTIYQATLHELLDGFAAHDESLTITGLALDSRIVSAGDLFIALAGETCDGRDFVAQAFERGAVAALIHAPQRDGDTAGGPQIVVDNLAQCLGHIASRFFKHPSKEMAVLGVTGTNGKTTCVQCVAQLLGLQGEACGVIGTLGVALNEQVTDTVNTTPDAITLQRQLATWRDQGVRYVAMEVSSHALDQGRVNGIAFDTAVFTNVSHDHLDYHGSMGAYIAAKQGLFATEGLRLAVVNADDQAASAMSKVVTGDCNVIRYSARANEQAQVRAIDAQYALEGSRSQLVTPWGDATLVCPLPGEFNLANSLACLAALGGRFPLEPLASNVSELRGAPGRMQSFGGGDLPRVIVDYAHTPDALARVLQVLRPHVMGELVCVFGCGGDRDRNKRPLMGAAVSANADKLIVTSDNPRSEAPESIIDDILVGCSGAWQRNADRAQAIAQAVAQAGTDDCVVVAGKGHEDYQIIGDQRLHFSDVEHVTAALQARVAA